MYTFRTITQWFLFFFIFLYFTTLALAQPVGTDSLVAPIEGTLLQAQADSLPPPEPFILFDSLRYRLFGDGNFARGNVNRTLMILRAEIEYSGTVVSLASHPRFTYGKQNGVVAERDLYADLFIDLYKKRKVYSFALATIETSNLRGINLRRLFGAGAGWRLRETKHHSLVLTNAILYESTDFRERATLTMLRNSTRLKGKHSFLQDKIRITHLSFLQPSLNDISNLRWSTLVSLELPLSKWVLIRTSYENSFESVVEATRKRNDSRLTIGVSIGNK